LTYTNGTADPVTYYYVLNLQGDVVKLVEHIRNGRVYTLNTVAEYTYDAWGKPLSTTDGEGNSVANTHIAKLNPLRYRGYYFDMETGFYYLQSRYYDPTLRRFINADSYQSTGQGILGHNMFAYCLNNPVNMTDLNGEAASSNEDTDGNGIPDYLDKRYIKLTAEYYARSSKYTQYKVVERNGGEVAVDCNVPFELYTRKYKSEETLFDNELFAEYYCKAVADIVELKTKAEREKGKNIAGMMSYEHIYQELAYHYMGYKLSSEGGWVYEHCKAAYLNFDEDRLYCWPMRYIEVP